MRIKTSASDWTDGQVHFVGVVAPERYLSGADVCLLPTRYDPAAIVVGEALACGTPIITTSFDGS